MGPDLANARKGPGAVKHVDVLGCPVGAVLTCAACLETPELRDREVGRWDVAYALGVPSADTHLPP